MEMTNSFQTIHKAWCTMCIWLVHQSFVTIPIGSRLSRIDPHDDKNLIFDLLLQVCQAMSIIQNRFFIIRRARTDHKKNPLVFSFDNRFQLTITRFFPLQGRALQTVKRRNFFFINFSALRNEYHTASFYYLDPSSLG